MTVRENKAAETHSLKILGISEAQEIVYRWLLGHPGATMTEMARELKFSPGKTQRLIESIEIQGLTTHSPELPRRYLPTAPDVALKALSLRRQEELQQADHVIQELQKKLVDQHPCKHEQIVELITSRKAMRLTHRQMMQSAQKEVVALSRPPMLITDFTLSHEHEQSWQRKAKEKGIRLRNVVDSELLMLPNAMQFVQSDIEAGEETKLIPRLPIKMVLVDQNVALIPLNLEQSDSASLLIRSSALLNLLYEVFEDIWSRSAPISFPRPDRIEIGDMEAEEYEGFDPLLKLMAAGANDKKIISELKVSQSTLTRSIVRLKKRFDARTRFQLGWVVNQHMNHR